MDRRTWLTHVVGGLTLGFVFAPGAQAADSLLDPELIKAGLRTATPEENGFVEYVVDLARRGVISPKVVAAAFIWARRKDSRRFQYFKRAVAYLAAKEGKRI
ncbi:hypothetical protein JCM19992_08450 [Thermostilla marina]